MCVMWQKKYDKIKILNLKNRHRRVLIFQLLTGGWLLVLNVVIGSSPPSQSFVVKSYRTINGFHSNNMVITKNAMKELRTHLPYAQLRFHCSKQKGRTFHVTTAANSTGNTVVQFFSGQTDVLPDSCGSFVKMTDDNSRLASMCHDWGTENGVKKVGKWSASGRGAQRLFNHPCFVYDTYHWVIKPQQPRMECDDSVLDLSSGDFWKVFVR